MATATKKTTFSSSAALDLVVDYTGLLVSVILISSAVLAILPDAIGIITHNVGLS